jgi:hypothetical protein
VDQYLVSEQFRDLAAPTQDFQRAMYLAMVREPCAPNSPHLFGEYTAKHMTAKHAIALRDIKVKEGKKSAANNRVKYLWVLFGWAAANGIGGVTLNITRDRKKVRKVAADNPNGHHTMTMAEWQQYCAHHPQGTMARLAGALCWNTGARVSDSDVVRFGDANRHGDKLTFTPHKTRRNNPEPKTIEIFDDLKETLSKTKLGDKTWLVG